MVMKVKFILNAGGSCLKSQDINKFTFINKYYTMIWRKVKKVIIVLIIAKLVILVLLIFSGDIVSISRDINYSSYSQNGYGNDTLVLKKQKLVRVVRNEKNRGISIIFRGKKNSKPQKDKEEELTNPIVD
jgi:hypothetical protein